MRSHGWRSSCQQTIQRMLPERRLLLMGASPLWSPACLGLSSDREERTFCYLSNGEDLCEPGRSALNDQPVRSTHAYWNQEDIHKSIARSGGGLCSTCVAIQVGRGAEAAYGLIAGKGLVWGVSALCLVIYMGADSGPRRLEA